MLDATTIHDLQRAMVPPTMMPPAIERAWISPAAERAEQILEPWISESEQQAKAWREAAREYERSLDDITSVFWNEDELGQLDQVVLDGRANAEKIRAWADGVRREGAKANRAIKARDPSSGLVHMRLVDRFAAMHRENVRVLHQLVDKLQAYRNFVDTRTGAGPSYEPKPWAPNAVTAAAMREAINGVGMRRVASVAELMAELHAEDD